MDKLSSLRKEIKKLDRKILKLIQNRMILSEKIGKIKKKNDIPLLDWSVEKEVINNAIQYAEKHNLNKNFVRAIITKIIEYSRIRQERLHFSAYSGKREDILIVGGLGGMGRWFAYFFQNQGHRVSINDLKSSGLPNFKYYRNLEQALKEKSIVIIATPLSTVPAIIEKIAKLKCDSVVCDIASVKSHIIPAIKKAMQKDIKITSIHPMFGPACHTLSDKIICLCDCGSPEANNKILGLFKDTAARLIKLPFDEHDKRIAYVLGLSHFLNILFAKCLINSGYTIKDLENIASTTFNAQLETTKSVIKENPELYYEIQALNPYNDDLFSNLKVCVDSLVETIKAGKKYAFIDIFKEGSRWLGQY